jgi:hypothetical protein
MVALHILESLIPLLHKEDLCPSSNPQDPDEPGSHTSALLSSDDVPNV